jgi:hypothetical protein
MYKVNDTYPDLYDPKIVPQGLTLIGFRYSGHYFDYRELKSFMLSRNVDPIKVNIYMELITNLNSVTNLTDLKVMNEISLNKYLKSFSDTDVILGAISLSEASWEYWSTTRGQRWFTDLPGINPLDKPTVGGTVGADVAGWLGGQMFQLPPGWGPIGFGIASSGLYAISTALD